MKNIETIMTLELDSGLCVILSDHTSHYFGGYYHVKVMAHCDVPLVSAYFDDQDQFADALVKLGKTVRFEKTLEKMAVPEDEINTVRNQLVESFINTVVNYLSAVDFDRRLVRKEYRLSCARPSNKSYSRFLT